MTSAVSPIMVDPSKLNSKQLKWVKDERKKALALELFDRGIELTRPLLPAVGLIGGFLAIDYLEQKHRVVYNWKVDPRTGEK